ncbi:MAG TPA: DUF3466 family protein [Chthoniobacterales bacterium]
MVDLGVLPTGFSSSANGINDAGEVVGSAYVGGYPQNDNGYYHAFLYSNGTMHDLGIFSDGTFSIGRGINNAGTVVGWADTTLESPPGNFTIQNQAFIYTAAGGLRTIGTFPSDDPGLYGPYSFAYAINAAEQVTGYSYDDFSHPISSSGEFAYIYQGGNWTNIGAGGNSNGSSRAFAINGAGVVAGYVFTDSSQQHAFFGSAGSFVDLGTLSGGTNSVAYGINDSGVVVGASETPQGLHGFVYENGSMKDLGTLMGGTVSEARAINSSGQIVGDATPAGSFGGFTVACLYADGVVYDLNTLVASGQMGGFSNLSQANAVNSKGWVAGFGTIEATGDTHAFLAIPLKASGTAAESQNISTRLNVQTGDNVLIGGFIITGSDAKKVILRAIGPSLAGAGVTGALADPTLELHYPDTSVVTNDNWKDTQKADIMASTIPPTNDLESAIVETLAPGAYTAIVRGKNGGTGVGLVEVYDLDQTANSQLANISTRGLVQTGTDVMIGGFILGPAGSSGGKVLIRGLGPSIPVARNLADPTLEIHDGNGVKIDSNDNWKINDSSGKSQEAAIRSTTVPPTKNLESAILTTLPPGNYTAIMAGKNDGTGVGLIEIYNLQ